MGQIELIQADITTLAIDAIVNAANKTLMGGGGVDGAIHRKGGPEILKECKKIISKIGSCEVGQAVITNAGNLPAKFVIHTVGPFWNGGKYNEEEKLVSCYKNCLELALKHHLTTIAFPNISTGAYRFPKQLAAEIAVKTVKEYLENHKEIKVTFCCYDEENLLIYKRLLS